MKQYGTVKEPGEDDPAEIYIFESRAGFRNAFTFAEDNDLVVINSGWLT
jgi:hypothetical protein